MIEFPGQFECQGLTCYPAGEEPNSFRFLPGRPEPEVDPAGRPALMSIPLPQGGYLQLGVHLAPGDEVVERLRLELARQLDLADPGLIRLAMAPTTVGAVRLLLGDGAGSLAEAGRSSSSGYPPYTALFHLQLDAQQQAGVAAALNGRTGFLEIEYELIVEQPVTATARLAGDIRPVLRELAALELSPDAAPSLRAVVEHEMEAGRLVMEVVTGAPVSDDLCRRVRTLAMDQMAELIGAIWHGERVLADETTAEVTAVLSEPFAVPATRIVDVATWFGAGAGPDHLVLPPGTPPTTAPEQ